ncbi:hypothetical protein SAMN04488134_1053 [Amphibacillus marinus]|uniref:Uncharacterized protein n=1 Tax=Amphibacillus marinus TaxID=872970 RepID=A0A1H8MUJ4_9BACI|nr:hypothetical protein SAMN04488134_1053 [Amphibacillus marinus]
MNMSVTKLYKQILQVGMRNMKTRKAPIGAFFLSNRLVKWDKNSRKNLINTNL